MKGERCTTTLTTEGKRYRRRKRGEGERRQSQDSANAAALSLYSFSRKTTLCARTQTAAAPPAEHGSRLHASITLLTRRGARSCCFFMAGPTSEGFGGDVAATAASDDDDGSDTSPSLPPTLESCAHLLAFAGYALESRRTPFLTRQLYGDDDLLVGTRHASYSPSLSPRFTRLHSLCLRGDLRRVALLLKVGLHPDAGDGRPLRLAIRGGHLDVARLLLERGASLRLRGRDDATPLLRCVRRGDLKMAALLLEHGADPGETYGAKLSPLHISCSLGLEDMVRLLVEKGKAPVEVEDELGRTPLFVAAVHQKERITRYLLESAKADPNAGRGMRAGNFRPTPLRRARYLRFDRIARMLEGAGGTED
jgi:ankyrin repeat protein